MYEVIEHGTQRFWSSEKINSSLNWGDLTGRRITQVHYRNSVSQAVNSIRHVLSFELWWGAESWRDFVHKLKIVLKELRETFVGLKIIESKYRNLDRNCIQNVIQETDALASIIYRSIETAKFNQEKEKW